jgi:hypothetical protein
MALIVRVSLPARMSKRCTQCANRALGYSPDELELSLPTRAGKMSWLSCVWRGEGAGMAGWHREQVEVGNATLP